MQSGLSNLVQLSSGGGQQSAAASALAGLLGTGSSTNIGAGTSFGTELSALLAARGGGLGNGRAQLLTTASPTALTAVVANLQNELSATGGANPVKATNQVANFKVGDVVAGLTRLNPELAAEIRGQIVDAVKAGEITLPPAWTKALNAGEPIIPQSAEETPDPAAVRDILAALGFIAPEHPSPAGPANGELPSSNTSSPAIATARPEVPATGSGLEQTAQATPPDGASTKATATGAGQPATADLAKSGEAAQRLEQSLGAPRERGNAAGTHSSRADTAAPSTGQGQTNGSANNSANNSSNGSGQQSTADNAGLQTQRTDQAGTHDKTGQPFLARLETTLEARGLTLASLISNGTGEPVTDEGRTLTQPGTTSIGQPLNAVASGTPTAAAAHAPAFAGWPPVAGQVALQLTRMVKDGDQNFTIRLDPPELGRVNVKLEIAHDGKVNAVVSVDNEKTLHLLQRDQAMLERALADAGLKADSGSLNFSLNQHGGADRQQADSRSSGVGITTGPIEEATDDLAATTIETASLTVSDRALDIKV